MEGVVRLLEYLRVLLQSLGNGSTSPVHGSGVSMQPISEAPDPRFRDSPNQHHPNATISTMFRMTLYQDGCTSGSLEKKLPIQDG